MSAATETELPPELLVEPSTKKLPEFEEGNTRSAMEAAGAGKTSVFMVPVSQLRVKEGFNLRQRNAPTFKENVQALKRSILTEGFYSTQPLAGHVEKVGDEELIYITNGHSRFEAVKLAIAEGAEITKLPVIIKPMGTTPEDLTVALVKENTGKPPTMFELSVVAKRLTNMGLTPARIAERLDMTPRYVEDLLLLVNSHKTIRQMVVMEQLAGSEAVKQIRALGQKKAAALFADALEKAEPEEDGKKRLTAKNLTNAGVKMKKEKQQYSFSKGEESEFSPDDPKLELISTLLGKKDWYTVEERKVVLTNEEGQEEEDTALQVVPVDDLKVTIVIERPEPPKPPKVEAAEPKRGRGRPKKVVPEDETLEAAADDGVSDLNLEDSTEEVTTEDDL